MIFNKCLVIGEDCIIANFFQKVGQLLYSSKFGWDYVCHFLVCLFKRETGVVLVRMYPTAILGDTHKFRGLLLLR